MPLRLDGEFAGQASTAVIGALPGGERGTAGEGLAQRQVGVIGLARADEEPHRTGPVFAAKAMPIRSSAASSRSAHCHPSLRTGAMGAPSFAICFLTCVT